MHLSIVEVFSVYGNIIFFILTCWPENYLRKYSTRFIKIWVFVEEFSETSCKSLAVFSYLKVLINKQHEAVKPYLGFIQCYKDTKF